jgi:integrase|tara:strand:- start:79 stop:570 length:492 start_codon:yes stop_codon:yes gene_type:complete
MAAFTLETGLRDQNVTKLKWSEVDMASQIATVNAKGDNLLSVPLNSNAVMILRQQLFQHPEYVFVLNGRPVDRPNNSGWKAALERAGIEDFRWHDLRHTWASWHVQCGTDLYTLKELGGWEEISMVMRYAHLAPKNLAAAQEMVESRAGFGQDAIHRGTGEHA